jgi:hypothetical protein
MSNETKLLLLLTTLAAGCKGGNTAPAAIPYGTETVLLSMNSIAAVSDNPPEKTILALGDSAHITKIMTYHWNSGQGSPPGTLALRDTQTGALVGPWPAVASKNGYDLTPGATWPRTSTTPPYLYWSVQPDVDIPAGAYEVVDSDPATWSYTEDTGNMGITFVLGWLAHPAGGMDAGTWAATDSRALSGPDGSPTPAFEAGTDSGRLRSGVTGTITTGLSTPLATQQIDTDGGTITVNVPGATLNGLTVTVPVSAYAAPQTFTVSSAPVTGHTFGSDFNPITPLITVDNGGAFSQKIITVRIPVSIPAGQFAMGFYYNPATQKLEGMATVSQDASSLTVATRHFSSFVLSAIDKVLLKPDIDTGFRPGIDDWEFPNYGSYLTSGHCTGQSMTAMWYYYEQPDGKDLTLYGRYDNNGNQPPTPDLWMDDSHPYRFASVVWNEMDWSSLGREISEEFIADVDADTWRLFAYSMQLTHQPQMTEIWNTAPGGGGHALVVYRIFGGNLYVADPNFPGNTTRRIEFADDTFTPYNSADNEADIVAGRYTLYDRITYVAKDSLSDWSKITKHWAEMKDGTIGNDVFPAYQIVWLDDAGLASNLTEGFVSQNAQIKLRANVVGLSGGLTVYRDGTALAPDAAGNFPLNKGNNLLGCYVQAQVGTDWRYLDFKYINVSYTPSTATVNIEGTWNPCATTAGLCNQWTFSGGSGQWIHGGFSTVDSLTDNFTYTLDGSTLTIRGLIIYDYGSDSPYTVTITGNKMTWQSIDIPSATFTFTK